MTAQPKSPRIENPAHLALVRLLPCCAPRSGNPSLDAHRGPIRAHHMTGAGLAIKHDDMKTMPLCVRHHDDFHMLRGVFRSFVKATSKTWQFDRIADTLAAVAALDMFTPDAIVTTGEFEGVF